MPNKKESKNKETNPTTNPKDNKINVCDDLSKYKIIAVDDEGKTEEILWDNFKIHPSLIKFFKKKYEEDNFSKKNRLKNPEIKLSVDKKNLKLEQKDANEKRVLKKSLTSQDDVIEKSIATKNSNLEDDANEFDYTVNKFLENSSICINETFEIDETIGIEESKKKHVDDISKKKSVAKKRPLHKVAKKISSSRAIKDDERVELSNQFESQKNFQDTQNTKGESISLQQSSQDSNKNIEEAVICMHCKKMTPVNHSSKSFKENSIIKEEFKDSELKKIRNNDIVIYKIKENIIKIPWTKEEEHNLLDGYKKYELSHQKWQNILQEYYFHENRTTSNLRDKYRSIVKKTSYYTNIKKNFCLVNENGDEILQNEQVHVFKENFPYTAAERIANFYKIDQGKTFYISEKDCKLAIYKYETYKKENEQRMKIIAQQIKYN